MRRPWGWHSVQLSLSIYKVPTISDSQSRPYILKAKILRFLLCFLKFLSGLRFCQICFCLKHPRVRKHSSLEIPTRQNCGLPRIPSVINECHWTPFSLCLWKQCSCFHSGILAPTCLGCLSFLGLSLCVCCYAILPSTCETSSHGDYSLQRASSLLWFLSLLALSFVWKLPS